MRRALIAAAAIAVPLLAYAQEATTNLPEQVVTATRVPTPIEQIPAGVTVISRAAIEERGYTTLAEALSAVPGATLVQSGGPGGNASFFIRGTNSDHVLVLRDGMPLNDPSDPGGQFNFGVDLLGDVERIEVVRGPMSSLYGTGAIGGVVNIITRKGAGPPHVYGELAAGDPRATRGQAGASGKTGPFDYSISLDGRDNRGYDLVPRRESVYTGAPKYYKAATATINLGYTPIEGTRVSAMLRAREASFALIELGAPTFDPSHFHGKDDALYGRFGVDSALFNGIWQTSLYLGRVQTDRHYIEPLEAADPNQTEGDTRYHGRRTSLEWNNTVHLADYGPAANSALVFGYEHIRDSSKSRLNESFFGFPFQQSISAAESSNAGHAGVQATLFKRLTATADVRGDEADFGGGAVTWRIGGVFAVPEILSRLKASYGTAFRAPSLFDLFGVDNNGYVGNPNLRPERSQGYELGWAIDVPALGRPDAATLDVTYFNNQIHDLIQVVFNSTFTASTTENVNRARSNGVETSLTLRPVDWLQGVVAYTYADARNQADNSLLLRRPLNQVSVTAVVKPLPNLTIAPELIYTGAFQDFITDNNGFPAAVGRSGSGTILNATVNYTVIPQVTLFLDGRNLTGTHFEPANGFAFPGFTLLAGLRVRY
jgi:vitamin B12 transporter